MFFCDIINMGKNYMKVIIKLILLTSLFLFCTAGRVQAQNTAASTLLPSVQPGAYSIIERSDWRRYDNGKYTGLTRHEVRASIIPRSSGGTHLYQGNFFVLESTLRDMRHSAQAVDAIIPVSFELTGNSEMTIENDRGYPSMRGFPAYPSSRVSTGSKWQAQANRALDPFNSGHPVIIPIFVEYEYRGTEQYQNMQVHRLHASYASRFQDGMSQSGIVRVQGSHKVDILVRVEDGLPVFMRDDLDETFFMADGTSVQFRGFTLTFGTGIVPLNKDVVITSLGDSLRIKKDPVVPSIQSPSIDVTPVPEGIRLTIKDIRFVSDSAEFLAAEKPRLDLIAEALKQIPDRTFLVEGHTAATGRAAGEMELSIERAKRMVDELVKRGISAERFIYKGWGGTKPVGDNSTDAGRSANRRVEITILE
jgi:outer membrane protein OmpA-like peptidoglycan-associated protein